MKAIFTEKKMPSPEENQEIKEKIKELQKFVSNSRDVREWKRGETVRLRVLGVSYQEIQKRLGVSISFIAKKVAQLLVISLPRMLLKKIQ